MSFFTTLTNDKICQYIVSARHSVILAAPGIEKQVASALIETQQKLPAGALQVVLDVAADVCRIGYGDFTAIELLQEAGIEVRQQPGLRLSVLICDNRGWSFASTPRLVEANADEIQTYNAIALTEMQIIALRGELPQTVQSTPGASSKPTEDKPSLPPRIGNQPVAKKTIETVKTALEVAPPQPFDLARQSSVYNSLIRYVELSIEGVKISSRKISLPKSLSLITAKDKDLKNRISASLKLIDKVDLPVALKEISEELESLRNAFLPSVGKSGRIITKEKEGIFLANLEKVREKLAKAQDEVKKELESQLENTRKQLLPDLIRVVMENPPLQFLGLFPNSKEGAEAFVNAELDRVFPTADQLVSKMNINCIFKDVTYESLKDKEFNEKVKSVLSGVLLDKALLDERVVANLRE